MRPRSIHGPNTERAIFANRIPADIQRNPVGTLPARRGSADWVCKPVGKDNIEGLCNRYASIGLWDRRAETGPQRHIVKSSIGISIHGSGKRLIADILASGARNAFEWSHPSDWQRIAVLIQNLVMHIEAGPERVERTE